MKFFSTALACTLLIFTACGGGGSGKNNGGTNPPAITYEDISGNWGLAGQSSVATKPDYYIGGVLTGDTGATTVTGIVHIISLADPFGISGGCYSLLTDVPVTGTIDTSNNVKLTSATVQGQVVSVTLVYVPGSPKTATGTYSITGGCADGATGKLGGATYANMSGNWSGSVKSDSTNLTYSLNSTISQPQTPNADGIFTLSGTVNFPNSVCFSTGTIQSSNNASVLVGGLAILTVSARDSVYSGVYDTIYIAAGINDPATSKKTAVYYFVNNGYCADDTGSGTMTRP